MDSIAQFFNANWEGILAVVVATAYLFDKIAALTSNKVDDKIAEKVDEALVRFGLKKPDAQE